MLDDFHIVMPKDQLIVMAGSFRDGATERGLSDGFRDAGWAVQEVDYRHVGVRLGESMAGRVASRITRRMSDSLYQDRILRECLTLKPAVFLSVKGVSLSASLLRGIKRTGAQVVMFYPDLHFEHPGVSLESFREYDLLITSKTFHVRYLRDLFGYERVAYVPHGFSGRVHRPQLDQLAGNDYSCDLLYAGTQSPYKCGWVIALAEALPDLQINIAGNRWSDCPANAVTSNCAFLGERTAASYARMIQMSKINVALHSGPSPLGWEDLVSTRTFEIPACKGFMLHIDNEEVREFFEPGREIDVFSTLEELVDKARFYLAHDEVREAMIERAYARAVPAYSYLNRAKEIARLLTVRRHFSDDRSN